MPPTAGLNPRAVPVGHSGKLEELSFSADGSQNALSGRPGLGLQRVFVKMPKF